ncbi:hypothetical protein Tco_1396137, partial [Tanacetum coccineum]
MDLQNESDDEDVENGYDETTDDVARDMSNTTGASTSIENGSNERVCNKVFVKWKWASNSRFCTKGSRILIGWNDNVVDVVVFSCTSQAIHTQVMLKADRKVLFCTFVYASNSYETRRELWYSLEMHKQFVNTRPWVIMGDFNAALFIEDTFHGSKNINISMRDFNDCVNKIEIADVNSTGLHYTWNQKPKGETGILKKIDRVMSNIDFNNEHPGSYAIFQPYRISDHAPAVLKIRKLSKDKPKPFKFFNFLAYKPDFMQLVTEHWKMEVQDKDPSSITLREEEAVYLTAFIQAALDEEPRVSRNRIDCITGHDNAIYEGHLVPNVFVQHYMQFIGTDNGVYPLNHEGLFVRRLITDKAANMIRCVSDDEIQSVMFSIDNDKAPGPDGYTSVFFKESWDVVGMDVCKAVRDFFSNGKLLQEINHTILSFLPKISTPTRVNDYRLISCCNVIYKCISKIITNRIKDGLDDIVSDNQSAFVPGRYISDNILLTQELMHNYHLNRGPPRCAFKIDIQKAYDTVNWKFLEDILVAFGFHSKMVKWIMAWVTNTSFSININGNLYGYFKGKRGLRQGDPLSRICLRWILIEALDEFKRVWGLVPSIPQSTIFICNVLDHVKNDILQLMPFERGTLPIKYLGVPLISSRLLYKDCKILIERVHKRITDWKNKWLSFAGEMKRGKAKVSWDDVCLPTNEGGLGVRKLDTVNIALMTSHIWKLITHKESMWVRWIHAYKLKKRSFWDVPLVSNVSWGWRKLLQIRNTVRPYFWYKIGNGEKASVWYDTWDELCPLMNHISYRGLSNAIYTLAFGKLTQTKL